MPWLLDPDWIAHAKPEDFWFWAIGLCLVGAAAFIAAFWFWKRLQWLADTPKSLIRSAAQGYVELQGRCRLMPGEPIMSPLTNTRCVWWSYRIDQKNSNSRGARWEALQQGTSEDLFFIEDHSGQCAVDPDHARIYPSSRQVWYGDSPQPLGGPVSGTFGFGAGYRYTELRIHENDPLYALGYFHTQGPISAGDINEEVRQTLVQWKRDQYSLIQRFDANHDGQMDMQEWDAAQAEARREVLENEREAMVRPPINVLSRASDGRPFILSTQPQKKLESRIRLYALGCLLTFFVAGAIGARMITLRLGNDSVATQAP